MKKLINHKKKPTPALSSGVGKVELSVPVSVELTTSLLASTVTLSSPLAGDMPTFPTPRIWKPRPFTPSPRPSPLVSPLLPKIEPKQTSPGQCIESWSSSWQIPQPFVPRQVKVETTDQQYDSGQEIVKALSLKLSTIDSMAIH